MPTAPAKPCHWPGCAALVHGRYCPEHHALQPKRQFKLGPGYGPEWPRLRARVLAREPRCRACGARATHVDHVVPRYRGGTDDTSNLQPLCRACHATKTGREGAAVVNAKRKGEGGRFF